jgi:signal transduction histidine kinase
MALVLSVAFLLLLAAFGALGEYALRGSEQQTRNEYLVIARMAAAQLDAHIAQTRAAVQQASDAIARSPDVSATQLTLSQYSRRLGSLSLDLVPVDASGRLLASAPGVGIQPDANLANSIEQASVRHAVVTSEPFQDAGTGRPVVAMAVPVEGGQPESVLVAVIALDSPPMLEPLAQAVQVGHTGHAGLIDPQGRVLASTFGLPFLSPGEHPAFFQEVMAKRQDEVKVVPFVLQHVPGETQGEEHLMAAAMLKEVPWAVDIGGDTSEAFAPLRRLRWGLAILGTVALFGIWGGSLWGTRLLVAPVYDVMRSAQRIAGGDLTVPLGAGAGAGGEIGAMAGALEQMRQRLLQTIESLEDLRATLEARVQDRTEALRQQEAQIRQLLHRVITAQEEERARIAYELHDEVGQLLTAIRFSMDGLPAETLDAETSRQVTRVRELIDRAMGDLRRLIAGLRPGVIDQLGLMPALREVSDQILAPLGIGVTIDGPQGLRLPPEVDVVLFRIAQEAMHNVARHSGASHVELSLVPTGDQVTMRVRDDGRGFDPAAVRPDATLGGGLGLPGMRERASLLGGRVRIDSSAGHGTTVEAQLPLPRLEAAEDDQPKEIPR